MPTTMPFVVNRSATNRIDGSPLSGEPVRLHSEVVHSDFAHNFAHNEVARIKVDGTPKPV